MRRSDPGPCSPSCCIKHLPLRFSSSLVRRQAHRLAFSRHFHRVAKLQASAPLLFIHYPVTLVTRRSLLSPNSSPTLTTTTMQMNQLLAAAILAATAPPAALAAPTHRARDLQARQSPSM